MTHEDPLLSLDRVTVRYGRTTACAAVSLDVARASVYALLGRNGAGKSSLIRCALGQQEPSEGVIRLFGRDPWTSRAKAMARVGVVPEDADAPPGMTARELSRFCRSIYARWDDGAVSSRLERFGVPRETPFGRLSKGEKRLVHLALALGHEPELLVLDDPTLGLDAVARHAFFGEIVGELADRGVTVFLTTHDLAGIEGIATRVGILKGGALLLDEDLETLKRRFRRLHYANSVTESRTAYGTELDAFDAVRVRVRGWGIDAVVSNFDERSFDDFRATDGVEDAEASAMSLEEIFLAVAGEEKGGAR